MSKVPDLKLIKKEDFDSKDQNLIAKLAFPLNNFMQQVINVFKNGVDFTNLNQQMITVTASVNSSGTPVNQIQFQSTLSQKIIGLTCINAVNKTSTIRFPSGTPGFTFSQNGTLITVLNISGLPIPGGSTNSDTYTFTLIAIGQTIPVT